MALKDIVKSKIKTITQSTIERLEDQVAAHEIEVERLNRNASIAYLDQVQGAPIGASAKAREQLKEAQEELEIAQGALTEARKQHAVKQDAEATADVQKRWRVVEKLGKRRRDISTEIDTGIENMVNAVNELIDVSMAMHSQVPVKTVGVTHTKLSRAAIEGAVRLNLSKRGFAWAAKGNLFGTDHVLTVRETIEQGNVETLAKKPTPESAAA
jgi:hypothetical protein